jgi:hypothetical protein
MKRTLIIYNTKETTQEEAAHLLDILNCDDSMIWDNADRCGVEIIEVPTDKTPMKYFTEKEVNRLLKVQRDKCAARATHFANEKADSPKIFNYVNSTPIEDF